uniref:Uncharacterized protein n=1 Tax=Amphimedon queenslandica TaxID=400682 RepID=A0A1X7SKH9_AMPQE
MNLTYYQSTTAIAGHSLDDKLGFTSRTLSSSKSRNKTNPEMERNQIRNIKCEEGDFLGVCMKVKISDKDGF